MDNKKEEPFSPGELGSTGDTTNIVNNQEKSSKGLKTLNPTKLKTPFKTMSCNQLIENCKNEPAQQKLIGNLIYKDEQTILFSPTALGKSLLAFSMGLSVSKGIDLDLGNNLILKNEVGVMNVILFDFELSARQLRDRIGNIDIPNNFFISKINRGKLLDGGPDKIFKYIKREAESVNAKFIIIDNITKIGNDLEKGENAIKFMEPLWELVRNEGYTVLIIAHTTKLDRKLPLTSDNLGGSSKIAQLADSLIGINEVNSEEGNKVYIKQIKTRNGALVYGKNNVICTEIIKENNGFVRHLCYDTCSEFKALSGGLKSDGNYNKKMFAAANYFYHSSYNKASEATGLPSSTLKQRVKSLETKFKMDYDNLKKMEHKDLKDQMHIYSDNDNE